MCLAISGKIESIHNQEAIALVMGTRIKININLIEDLKIGEYVLIHTGFAIQKINVDEALFIEEAIYNILQEDDYD